VTNSYVMKVSSNGQVSIPADARTRWHSERVVVVDLGDRVVIRPLPDEPLAPLVGKYGGVGSTTDQARRAARAEDADRERRKQR
jgi:bifunctional DNA-binding transcriptional regulator/antitoxin component of YhaV-PrlF toxin-antitoxin module